MTQGKHFAAGGDHFAALPNKKIHTPKGIARLTVTAATMAAMTGSSLISPFTAFAQTGDGQTRDPLRSVNLFVWQCGEVIAAGSEVLSLSHCYSIPFPCPIRLGIRVLSNRDNYAP